MPSSSLGAIRESPEKTLKMEPIMDTQHTAKHRAGGKHAPAADAYLSGEHEPRTPGRHALPPLPDHAPLAKAHGRRAAAPPETGPLPRIDDPANTGPLATIFPALEVAVVDSPVLRNVRRPRLGRNKLKHFAAMVTTGGFLFSAGIAAIPVDRVTADTEGSPETDQLPEIFPEPLVTAETSVELKHSRVDVKTEAAPPPPPPVVEEPVAAPLPPQNLTPAPITPPAPRAVPVAPAPAPVKAVPAPAPKPVPAPAPVTSKQQIIVSAALGQLGRYQDCTMLVTNSLAAAGINFHDWPIGYFSLGRQIPASEAVAGDLLYYADGGSGLAHIAVYLGGGMAVHGGFNGNETVRFTAYVGSGPVFIRVN